MSSWWDKIGESFDDGIGKLVDAGIDRAAYEIQPVSSTSVSQNPTTHAITQNVGVNADVTTVTTPVVGAGIIPAVTNSKVLLIGAAVLLGGAWLFTKKRG